MRLCPLAPPLFFSLHSPNRHTCSGTQPCASEPGQGREQTAPVFSDNHHIAHMPVPNPYVFLCVSRLPSYLPPPPPLLHLPCRTSTLWRSLTQHPRCFVLLFFHLSSSISSVAAVNCHSSGVVSRRWEQVNSMYLKEQWMSIPAEEWLREKGARYFFCLCSSPLEWLECSPPGPVKETLVQLYCRSIQFKSKKQNVTHF